MTSRAWSIPESSRRSLKPTSNAPRRSTPTTPHLDGHPGARQLRLRPGDGFIAGEPNLPLAFSELTQEAVIPEGLEVLPRKSQQLLLKIPRVHLRGGVLGLAHGMSTTELDRFLDSKLSDQSFDDTETSTATRYLSIVQPEGCRCDCC